MRTQKHFNDWRIIQKAVRSISYAQTRTMNDCLDFCNGIISQFYCPAKVHSDKGSTSRSKILSRSYVKGITMSSTTVFQTLENKMIDRWSCTIEQNLKMYVGDHHNTWSMVFLTYGQIVHLRFDHIECLLLRFGRTCAVLIACTKEYTTKSALFCFVISNVWKMSRIRAVIKISKENILLSPKRFLTTILWMWYCIGGQSDH